MVVNAVVFGGRNGLDSLALRVAVVRIPEVSLRIREAQAIFDKMGLDQVDLLTYITSEDETFLKNIKLKSLAAAIVQVALFERFKKYQKLPQFLIGNSNGDSALHVCAGQLTFVEMVQKNSLLQNTPSSVQAIPVKTEAPILAGTSLTEYEGWRLLITETGATVYEKVRSAHMDLKTVVTSLVEEFGVHQFINIGPSSPLISAGQAAWIHQAEIMDSIEMDPMLTWFWRSQRPVPSAASH